VGVLRLDRPRALNALNSALLTELKAFLARDLPGDDVRVLILTGAGDRAFAAGADVAEMRDFDPLKMRDFCDLGHTAADLLETAPLVTIAAVNGFALGGGLELALACDFIYASSRARMGQPEVTLGLIPGFGGTQRLSRAIGSRRAKELIFTGQPITADEGRELGLVNRVVPGRELLQACLEVAQKIAANAWTAVLQAKRVMHHGDRVSLSGGLAMEKDACALCFASPDQCEGLTAFLEKRQPRFL
jgi:enoyl-CoA hydratase